MLDRLLEKYPEPTWFITSQSFLISQQQTLMMGVERAYFYHVIAQIQPISTQEHGNCRYDEIDESNSAGVGPCESLYCQYLGHIDADFTMR